MSKILITYALSAVLFITVDFLWLGLLAREFYQTRIGELLAEDPNLLAGIVFYLLYTAGIVYFAVLPAVRAQSLKKAIGGGAFLGAVAYSAYELSNFAVLRGWPIELVVVDILWGTLLTTLVSAFGYWLYWKLLKR